jgi:ribose transport system substrate-binding protein
MKMKIGKKLCWMVFSVMLLAAFVPQTVYAGGSSDASSGKKPITVIMMADNSDWWNVVKAGARLAAKETGYTVNVIGPNAESDYLSQMNMIEDAVANKVGAIALAANEPKAVIPSVEKAKAAGIPVILFDARLSTDDTSLYKSYIGTGNIEAGRIAGKYLADRLNKGDKVAIIRGLVGQTVHDERANGAIEAFKAADMNIVAIQPADSRRDLAVSVVENILQNHPDLKCIYATNDEMALGAYQAVENAQKKMLIMGFDGAFPALDSIAAGQLTASVAQGGINFGYLAVKTAIDVIEGRPVKAFIPNEVVVVDKNNVAAFRNDLDEKVAQSK